MRIVAALGLVMALLLPASALAKGHTFAPPGNSGVNQYVESVPTAGGKKPANSVHPSGGGGGVSGGGGGGGGSISPSTQQQFAHQGAAGTAAVALARATAPSGGSSSRRAGRHGSGQSGSGTATGAPITKAAAGFSPVSSLFKAFTGSSSGGLGAFLPIILVVSALAAMAAAIFRRRRATRQIP
jgi:hypothetical protein